MTSTTARAVVIPDAAKEIRLVTLHAMRGINFWSRRPVVRMDVSLGEFDDVSSADVPGVIEALMTAMPGLIEHECSIGARGGFRQRLRRGTYAPHIIEHVALELQTMIGCDVGYGRTRGGDHRGEYTIVFEHRHEQVGLRAAALALDAVQRAFSGTLDTVSAMVTELKTLSETPDAPPLAGDVFCAITGGSYRLEAQEALRRRLKAPDEQRVIVDLSPAYLLQAGLPYSRSEMAIVLDAEIGDVPERYQDASMAQRLVSIVADGVGDEGIVVCPAKEWEIQDYAREQGCRVAIFAPDDEVTSKDARVAMAVGLVRDGHVVLESEGELLDAGPLGDVEPATVQAAAALSAWLVRTDQ